VTQAQIRPADVDARSEEGIVLVPHTHWDREWYEPHDVFRLRLVHMLDEVVRRLEADPDFRFTLDGQSAAIEDYLDIRPERVERVQRLVRAGRLVLGPFLILLDEFCCDGETIVRNLELGIASAERFGGAMPVGYLPDMFGHTAQMPQLLRGFGIEHAALWRGVPAAVQQHAFAWASPDGSAVRCEYLFDGYGSALDLFAVPGQLAGLAAGYRHQTRGWYGADPVLGMYGTDHMAPAPDLMDRVREHNADPEVDTPLRVATLQEYILDRAASGDHLRGLPEVRGELRSHARGNLLPGVFSVRTNLKAAMAHAELCLTRAERIDALHSGEDHRSFFDLAWHRVVESSAHDSVTGCGVDATADQVTSRLATAGHVGRAVIDRVARQLAAAVPAGAHLVLNTLPWPRPVQAEFVVTGGEEDPLPAQVQAVDALETRLGDEQMPTGDLVKILRRIHGRELFGQQIVEYRWGDDSLHFEVAEVPEGTFDLARLSAEVHAAMEAPGAAHRLWRVVTTARPLRRLITEVEVPPLGHVAVGAGHRAAALEDDQVHVRRTRLDNGLVTVEVASDGTLTVTGVDGTALRGVGRLVDEGDRGDAYNFAPAAQAEPVDAPESVTTTVLARGPLRGVIAVERTYRLPVGIDAQDRDTRSEQTRALHTRMLVEVRRHEPFVRVSLDLVNTVGDHRLRLHVPLGEQVSQSFGAGQFDVTRRGRSAEGGWGEFPLPTFPATGFVSAGPAHLLLDKLTEYEVVTPERSGADELAVTLLRAVGMMSVNVHPLRDEPAGSQIPVPGAQYLGQAVPTRLAVLAHRGGWEAADAARWAEVFRHDPVVYPGTAPAGAPLPPPVAGPRLEGPAILTSLRTVAGRSEVGQRSEETEEEVLEARLVNLSDREVVATLGLPDGRDWVATDLRGQSTGSPVDRIPAHGIHTMRTRATRGDSGAQR
jgi:mannosylglycerate hydrolase